MIGISLGYTDLLLDLIKVIWAKTVYHGADQMMYSPDSKEDLPSENPLKIVHIDDFWIARFQNGDQGSFHKIFKEYYRSLVYYANRFVTDKEVARDITQDVFTKLWHKREVMQNQQNIKAFLFVTTRNTCLNYIRHNKVVRQAVAEINFFEKTDSPVNDILKLEAEITHTELLHYIHEAISKLQEKYQQIIRLVYFENKSNQEVADLLKMPYQTVNTHKIRALRLLKASIAKSFYS